MSDEIDNVRNRLSDVVVPGVRAAIPDAAFGLALLGEFPVEPFGPPTVRPYELRAPVTRDVVRVEGGLEATRRGATSTIPRRRSRRSIRSRRARGSAR